MKCAGYRDDHFAACLSIFFMHVWVAAVTVYVGDDSPVLKLFLFGLVWGIQTFMVSWQLPFDTWIGNAAKVAVGLATLGHSAIMLSVQSGGTKTFYFYSLLFIFTCLCVLLLMRQKLPAWCPCSVPERGNTVKKVKVNDVPSPSPSPSPSLEESNNHPHVNVHESWTDSNLPFSPTREVVTPHTMSINAAKNVRIRFSSESPVSTPKHTVSFHADRLRTLDPHVAQRVIIEEAKLHAAEEIENNFRLQQAARLTCSRLPNSMLSVLGTLFAAVAPPASTNPIPAEPLPGMPTDGDASNAPSSNSDSTSIPDQPHVTDAVLRRILQLAAEEFDESCEVFLQPVAASDASTQDTADSSLALLLTSDVAQPLLRSHVQTMQQQWNDLLESVSAITAGAAVPTLPYSIPGSPSTLLQMLRDTLSMELHVNSSIQSDVDTTPSFQCARELSLRSALIPLLQQLLHDAHAYTTLRNQVESRLRIQRDARESAESKSLAATLRFDKAIEIVQSQQHQPHTAEVSSAAASTPRTAPVSSIHIGMRTPLGSPTSRGSTGSAVATNKHSTISSGLIAPVALHVSQPLNMSNPPPAGSMRPNSGRLSLTPIPFGAPKVPVQIDPTGAATPPPTNHSRLNLLRPASLQKVNTQQ
jgi:hypothetical protein